MGEIKRIDVAEFRSEGYLQEVNRRFLHPLGLALEVTRVDDEGWAADNPRVKAMAEAIDRAADAEDLSDFDRDALAAVDSASYAIAAMNALYPPGSEHISGCWDYRDDPEGIFYEGVDLIEHARHVWQLEGERVPARQGALGYWIQPSGAQIDNDGLIVT